MVLRVIKLESTLLAGSQEFILSDRFELYQDSGERLHRM